MLICRTSLSFKSFEFQVMNTEKCVLFLSAVMLVECHSAVLCVLSGCRLRDTKHRSTSCASSTAPTKGRTTRRRRTASSSACCTNWASTRRAFTMSCVSASVTRHSSASTGSWSPALPWWAREGHGGPMLTEIRWLASSVRGSLCQKIVCSCLDWLTVLPLAIESGTVSCV